MFRVAPALIVVTVAAPAWAHPGHGAACGFIAGLLHPLTGFDHLAAILLVGVIGGSSGGRRGAALPIVFMGAMLNGFVLAVGGVTVHFAELLIVGSLIVLTGALVSHVTIGRNLPVGIMLSLIMLFGAAHGYAHGEGLAGGRDTMLFAAGFALTTSVLLALAYGVAHRAQALKSRAHGAWRHRPGII